MTKKNNVKKYCRKLAKDEKALKELAKQFLKDKNGVPISIKVNVYYIVEDGFITYDTASMISEYHNMVSRLPSRQK